MEDGRWKMEIMFPGSAGVPPANKSVCHCCQRGGETPALPAVEFRLKTGLRTILRRFKTRIQHLLRFQRPHRPVIVQLSGEHLGGKVAENMCVLRGGMADLN